MDTRYLFKRYNTWWVKVAVPKNLRDELGYDLRRSLKTHELEKAKAALSARESESWRIKEEHKYSIEEQIMCE